jgi:hypothetical protein
MEGLYLTKQGAKYILLCTGGGGGLAASSVPLNFQPSSNGPLIFPGPMFIRDIIK